MWNNGSFAWIRAEDCWTWPLKEFFALLSWLSSRDHKGVCSIYHTGQTFEAVWAKWGQSPFFPFSVLSLAVWETNEFLKNFIYSLWFHGLASKILQSSLVFLRSDGSFLFLFSLLSLVSVFLVDSSIIPLYVIKFLYSVCHCAQAVLCSVTSNSFPSETPHPNSSLKLLAEAFVLSASPYVYKLEISSLCLTSKAICCLRPFHELVYSCG